MKNSHILLICAVAAIGFSIYLGPGALMLLIAVAYTCWYYGPGPGKLFHTAEEQAAIDEEKRAKERELYEARGGRAGELDRLHRKELADQEEDEKLRAWHEEQAILHDEDRQRTRYQHPR